MRFSKEVIDQKIEQIPENIREAVFSNTVSNAILDIAKKYGLHIDQIGILEEEALYAIIGLQTPEQFFESLVGRMHISQSTALNLTQEISTNVMSAVNSASEEKEEMELTDRESILSEIENPSPINQPISAGDNTKEGPAMNREVLEIDNKSDDAVAQEFISGKLKETVNMPAKKVKIDPYREPVE